MSITQEQASIVGKYLWSKTDIPTVNIAVMGGNGVGKRSMLRKLCHDCLFDEGIPLPAELGWQRHAVVQGKEVHVRFDLIAEEDVLPPNEACILVYDVTSKESFQVLAGLRTLYMSRRRIPRRQARRTTFFVVANKIDRWRGDWTVSLREADEFSEQIDARFLQMSALTGRGTGDEVVVDMVSRVVLSRIGDEAGPKFMTRPVPIEEDRMTMQVCNSVFKIRG